jgi:hypothetical protein
MRAALERNGVVGRERQTILGKLRWLELSCSAVGGRCHSPEWKGQSTSAPPNRSGAHRRMGGDDPDPQRGSWRVITYFRIKHVAWSRYFSLVERDRQASAREFRR